MKNRYMRLIHELDEFKGIGRNEYNASDVEKFLAIHEKLRNVFLKAYEHFTERKGRSWDSYTYLKELDQTVCPYCNANFIQTIQAERILKAAKSRAMADLDHFLPKSLFPIFTITLSNLVPSCIYCNQRFKGEHQTNFHDYLSPFDLEIKDAIKFRISYSNTVFSSAFDKLKELPRNQVSAVESCYIKLLSFKRLAKIIEENQKCHLELRKKQCALKKELDLLESESPAATINLVNEILQKSTVYLEQLEEFIVVCSESGEMNTLEVYATELIGLFSEIINLRNNYENIKGRKGHRKIRSAITAYKNEIEEHIILLKSTFNIEEVESNQEIREVDFVEISLGKSEDYQIEIIANNTETSIQRKVYNNAALFQIEAVYNQFHAYINRRIRKSYILSDLYKSQLADQFPELLSENLGKGLGEMFLVSHAEQRHEVLGKLTCDLILPTIESGKKLEMLEKVKEA